MGPEKPCEAPSPRVRDMSRDRSQAGFSRAELLVVVGITLVAAALRAYRLDYWPMYGDETLTMVHIEKWDAHISISPLAYLPVAGLVKVLGQAWWVWRLWPCLVGVASVPLLYVLVRRLSGATMAAWTAAFLAASPWHIAQSQTARHYPLQMLVGLLAVYATYRALENDSLAQYALSVFWGLVAVLTRPSSIYLMFIVFAYCGALWVWPALRPPTIRWRRVLGLVVGHAALVVFAYELTKVYGEGTELWGHSPLHVLLTVAYYSTAPLVCVALLAAALGLRLKDRPAVLFGLYAFVPVAMVAATAVFRSAIGVAAFLVLPGMLLLAAWAIETMRRRSDAPVRWFAALLGTAVLGGFAARDLEYFTNAHGYRAPIRQACAYIRDHRAPGELVGFNTSGLREEMSSVIGDTASISLFSAALDTMPVLPTESRTWFVSEDIYSTWDIADPARQWLNAHARLMTVIPAYVGPRSHSLWIYLYTPPGLADGAWDNTGRPAGQQLSP